MSVPTPDVPPSILTPSKIDSLKGAVSSPTGIMGAFVGALSSFMIAMTVYLQGQQQQTARVSYDTLKTAFETLQDDNKKNTVQIVNLQTWVQDLSGRLELKQLSTEKAIARKQNKPQAAPIILPPSIPAPIPPPIPVVVEPAPLPTFDTLKH